MELGAGSQFAALNVVDRVLAAKNEQEEQLGEAAAEPDDPPAAEPPSSSYGHAETAREPGLVPCRWRTGGPLLQADDNQCRAFLRSPFNFDKENKAVAVLLTESLRGADLRAMFGSSHVS